ncbi:hypothetical protein C7H19_19370 [Aphanothece hegewaldii CCALA 016]|uniref:Uncharacterized protein n=1 Tax=Aphanothece hegewaldii CCALA 016 TaxID=2107694 RepID=A0A2T1LTB6_9CHRO|nr:hypothetical protein [Aphanothece hegewaldii]PSF33885.1 hypothetical protein C7H19_19370 [Aphanothece hegewaldii CCALA 016]
MQFKANLNTRDSILASLQVKQAMEKQIKSKLAFVRCPEHKTTVQNIKVTGNSASSFKVEMKYCCDQLKAEIEKALK